MPLGSLRQQLIFPQYEDGQQVVESDAVLRRLAAEARLPSAFPSIFTQNCKPLCHAHVLGGPAWSLAPATVCFDFAHALSMVLTALLNVHGWLFVPLCCFGVATHVAASGSLIPCDLQNWLPRRWI